MKLADRVQAAVARAEAPAVAAPSEEDEQLAGYFWNEAKFCEPCLKVLDVGSDFHLDLVPAAEEMEYEPLLRTGKEVTFKVDGVQYGGVIERRQTFYQACLLALQ